jgi:hypothetical protein
MVREGNYVHQLAHEIKVMKGLADGTAEAHEIHHELAVINPHAHPLSFYFSVQAADSDLLEQVNSLGAGPHGLFTEDHIYSDINILQTNFDYWLV